MMWGTYTSTRCFLSLIPSSRRMPLKETVDTFSYFIKEALKLKLAYIVLSRYQQMFDPTGRGTPHDAVATYADLFAGSATALLANGGFTPDEAATNVTEGKVKGVFFGFLWIGHPDLALRIQNGKPLDAQADFATLYGYGGSLEDQKKGYTDYPVAA